MSKIDKFKRYKAKELFNLFGYFDWNKNSEQINIINRLMSNSFRLGIYGKLKLNK